MRMMRSILDKIVANAKQICSTEAWSTPDTIRVAVASSQFQPSYVFVFAETVPPPYLDHDVGAPFHMRLNSFSRCETLSTECLKEIIETYNLPSPVFRSDPTEARVEILTTIKKFLNKYREGALPSVDYYTKLSRLGYLRKYKVELRCTPSRSMRNTRVETIQDLTHSIESFEQSYRILDLEPQSNVDHYHIALEYFQALGIDKGERLNEVSRGDADTLVNEKEKEVEEQIAIIEHTVV
jgi:hypothetical protein